MYGKDPIPSNTEDVEQWRRTHPRPARGSNQPDARESKQAAEESWASAKRQTKDAANDVKGMAQEAADDAKGKARDVKGKANETADEAKEKADETADGVTAWAKSWFGMLITAFALFACCTLLLSRSVQCYIVFALWLLQCTDVWFTTLEGLQLNYIE